MKPEAKSLRLLAQTRAKAKMHEYDVPLQEHINLDNDPARLFSLAIALMGDYAVILCNTPYDTRLEEVSGDLRFSAFFFDAYLHSKLNDGLSEYSALLGACAYYLCNLPGSSRVLTKLLHQKPLELKAGGLEKLIFWILKGSPEERDLTPGEEDTYFFLLLNNVKASVTDFFLKGISSARLYEACKELREVVFRGDEPRQVLFADLACALVRVMYENSSWRSLPEYTSLPKEVWGTVIEKKGFLAELWPSQHLLGKQGVLQGRSAVIQMPTSAGKTRATELIIRSAFLAKRTSLAIIIAPFKALCQEIRQSLSAAFAGEPVAVEEFTDVIQNDFEIDLSSFTHQVLVVTPEKLVYVLKQGPEFAKKVGLLIYDEGHQFDSGARGVTYELLLTTLNMLTMSATQKILISAVLSNAEAISSWLSNSGQVVSGLYLTPNLRSIAFVSWAHTLGSLVFVNEKNPNEVDYFVPRIIEQVSLGQMPNGGRKKLGPVFPEQKHPPTISLYLGLRLSKLGGVAIFCGNKVTASSIIDKVVEAYERGLHISSPAVFASPEEIDKLVFLIESNLGVGSAASKAAKLGVFGHHNNVPTGVRLSVEYALRKNLITLVVCTSTLAQGVNLPFKYLIMSSAYQAGEPLSARDFHNLIGRAGRSGFYTEGTIIFSDPKLFDHRLSNSGKWSWGKVCSLLQVKETEPCKSSLYEILAPIQGEKKETSVKFDVIGFVNEYANRMGSISIFLEDFAADYSNRYGFIGLNQEIVAAQLADKIRIVYSIESFLLSYCLGAEDEVSDGVVVEELVARTFAFHSADAFGRLELNKLFDILAKSLVAKVPDLARRRLLGRTLYGVEMALKVETWVLENKAALEDCAVSEQLLRVVWPLVEVATKGVLSKDIFTGERLLRLVVLWIKGVGFNEIEADLRQMGVKKKVGKGLVCLSIDEVVGLCQNFFGYECVLPFGAVCSFYESLAGRSEFVVELLKTTQKQLRYGCNSLEAILLFELGFSDRIVASRLSYFADGLRRREEVIQVLRERAPDVLVALQAFPSYFKNVLDDLLN